MLSTIDIEPARNPMSIANTYVSARIRLRKVLTRTTVPEFSPFEYWPGWVFYTPVVLQWLALGLRYHCMTLPTAANPLIETGGMCGESKTAILDQVGASERKTVAPYVSFITTSTASTDLARAQAAIKKAGLTYPLVAKPDIGCNGAGVKIIREPTDLTVYLARFPAHARAIRAHGRALRAHPRTE